ncbi:putative reverse transcriptase domain-containing protein [Tanacetum coccineum]
MPLPTYLNLGLGELAHTKLTVELADRTVKYPKGIAKNVLVGIGKFTFPVDFIILDMPEDIKVPLILRRPFLSTARAKIDVYKRNITLRVGEKRIVFNSVKPASSLIKMVYMLSLRERMELDLEDRLKGESLVLNRSLDPFLEDYIKLNDLNEPFELRRNQGDDLMSTIEEGEVIEEFRTRDDELDIGIDDYFNKMVYKGNNVIRALMNVPIFVGTFFVVTDFVVLENMDAYRDEGMGNVIFGEPFLREVGIKTKQYEGIITIYNGDDEVTYQMVRSHSRFKHHTNEQCNKIPPLLKVFETFKVFKNEVENQLGKTIKALRSDRGLGNGEALVSGIRMKTQHKYLSKCIFIGYPKETMGYYFYFPPENKIVVARYAEFFEKNLITQEVSGRAMDLEEIQDEDTSPL